MAQIDWTGHPLDWTGHPPFGRQVSLKHTLELVHEKRGDSLPLIVELGTAETYSPDGLGNALIAFSWYAGKYGARIKTVDIREGAVKNAREILKQYVSQGAASIPEITHADAFDWVTGLHEPINLLYVDAGFELVGEFNYRAFVKRHPEIPSFYVELLNQFDPACFHSGSLMLIDDTDPGSYDGKGIFLIPYLLDRGWRKVDLRGVPVFPMVLLEKV